VRKSHKQFARSYYDPALGHLRGRVLDVGCGANPRLSDLGPDVRVCGIDITESRLARAKGARPGPDQSAPDQPGPDQSGASSVVSFVRTDAARLPFGSHSFDGIAISFALCAVGDIDAVCAELRRVAKPGAPVVVIEHVRAQVKFIVALQRVQTALRQVRGRCRADRDPLAHLAAAGFVVARSVKSVHLAPLQFIVATAPREA
jgi:ubiquinone/menaquinone biosynthesis C-methylase UbiE